MTISALEPVAWDGSAKPADAQKLPLPGGDVGGLSGVIRAVGGRGTWCAIIGIGGTVRAECVLCPRC
jgi:hypothetical protein